VAILGPEMGEKRFSPLKFLGTRTNTPMGDKLFQNIQRRVAKFRDSRPRSRNVEKSVHGKR